MEWLILLALVMVVVAAVAVLAGPAARAGRDETDDAPAVGSPGPRHYDLGAGAGDDGDGGE